MAIEKPGEMESIRTIRNDTDFERDNFVRFVFNSSRPELYNSNEYHKALGNILQRYV